MMRCDGVCGRGCCVMNAGLKVIMCVCVTDRARYWKPEKFRAVGVSSQRQQMRSAPPPPPKPYRISLTYPQLQPSRASPPGKHPDHCGSARGYTPQPAAEA